VQLNASPAIHHVMPHLRSSIVGAIDAWSAGLLIRGRA
jgi:hypothetical protein